MRLSGGSAPREIDLRTRRTEADRMRPLTRATYLVALWAIVGTGAILLGFDVAEMLTRRSYGLTLERGPGDTLVVSSPPVAAVGLAAGARVLEIGGEPLPPGPSVRAAARAALETLPGPEIPLTVLDPDTDGGPRVVTVPPVRRPLSEGFHEGLWAATLIVVGALGLLALQARDRSPAVPVLLQLCLVAGVTSVPFDLAMAWNHWVGARAAVANPIGIPEWSLWVLMPVALIVPVLFGYLLLELLYLFPTPEPAYRNEFPVPARVRPVTLALLVLVVVFAAVAVAVGPGGSARALRWSFSFTIGNSSWMLIPVVSAVLLVVYWPVWVCSTALLVLRLARRRVGEAEPGSEEHQQLRVALGGIRTGALLFLLSIAIFVGWPILDGVLRIVLLSGSGVGEVDGVLGDPPALLALTSTAAVAAPFVGMALAITRRGLWDVDLVAQRAALFSALGGAFLLFWFLANEMIEAFFPSGLAGAGPVLAAVAVAGLRRPAEELAQRAFPGAVDFEVAMERAAARLGGDADGPLPAHLGATLVGELGCRRAAVLTRDGMGAFGPSWSTGDDTPPAGFASAVPSALATGPDVLVRTDRGPLLATRVGPADGFPALVVLGPRGDGRFFTSRDRRTLSLVLAPLARLFRREPA